MLLVHIIVRSGAPDLQVSPGYKPLTLTLDLVVSSALLYLLFFFYLLQVVGHCDVVEEPVIHGLCVVGRSGALDSQEVTSCSLCLHFVSLSESLSLTHSLSLTL